jgi:hypothetical protein
VSPVTLPIVVFEQYQVVIGTWLPSFPMPPAVAVEYVVHGRTAVGLIFAAAPCPSDLLVERVIGVGAGLVGRAVAVGVVCVGLLFVV